MKIFLSFFHISFFSFLNHAMKNLECFMETPQTVDQSALDSFPSIREAKDISTPLLYQTYVLKSTKQNTCFKR